MNQTHAMTAPPQITVVIPVYKTGNFLRQCVDSLLAQCLPAFELILIDDGSPDHSGEICDEYANQDKRIRVIHQENTGVSTTRNRGIEEARGNYIVFVDSDDYVDPDYLSSLLDAQKTHPTAGHFWCGIAVHQGKDGGNTTAYVCDTSEPWSVRTRTDLMELFNKWLLNSPCCKVYKTKILHDKNIRFAKDLSLGEDLLFNLQYLDANRNAEIIIINRPLYHYMRLGNESLHNRYYPNLAGINNRLHSELLRHLKMFGGDSPKSLTLLYSAWFFSLDRALTNTFHQKNHMGFLQKIRTNTAIMRSPEYMECLSKSDLSRCHPLYVKVHKWRHYFGVYIYDLLLKLRQKIAAKIKCGRSTK